MSVFSASILKRVIIQSDCKVTCVESPLNSQFFKELAVQRADKQLSGSRWAVVGQLLGSYRVVVGQSLGSCQAD